MAESPNPIRLVDDVESWRLLCSAQIGRIASARDGNPDIFPVSYLVKDRKIYFRTAADSRLRREAEGLPVAFEAAAHDGLAAWSVVVLGTLSSLDPETDQAVLDRLPILDFAPSQPYVWLYVDPQEVRGRRFDIPRRG